MQAPGQVSVAVAVMRGDAGVGEGGEEEELGAEAGRDLTSTTGKKTAGKQTWGLRMASITIRCRTSSMPLVVGAAAGEVVGGVATTAEQSEKGTAEKR